MVAIACTPAASDADTIEAQALRPLVLDGGVTLLPAWTVVEPPVAAPPFAAPTDLPAGRSFSIGTAGRGYLVGGQPLRPTTAALQVRPISVKRRAVHGTQELLGALQRAADHVASRWPGSVLWAGDLSREGGGDLRGHASHNSGRDADLTFYLRDAAGRQADRPDMARIGQDLRTADRTHAFDVARNWALIAALLRDPGVQVQWIFVAHHLRGALLAEGARAEAEPKLLERAAEVLRQPRDSSAHAEHFHVRLYCALEERVEGCLDTGRMHPWIDRYEEALSARVAEVLPFLRSPSAEEIRYAITRIVRLRVRAAAGHIDPLRDHPDPSVAALATDATDFLRGARTPPTWSHLTDTEDGE